MADRQARLPSQRHLFDVPADVAYFNTANLSPLLTSVREAGEQALRNRAHPWEISPPDWFSDVERLRHRAAQLFNATTDDVAFIPATSYGLATVAQNLPLAAGQRILVLHEEYPSNYYTWRRHAARSGAELVVVSRERGQMWGDAIVDALDDRVAVVAVPNVHWTDGALIDLPRVASATRELGAALVIDASQSLGVMPLDVRELRPDAVVAVGYKWLLGPFSLGYLYIAEHHRDGVPLEENWINRDGSDDFAGLVDYTDSYLPGARRFDVGQRTNFGLVPMAVAALDQILEWGIPAIADALRGVTDRLAAEIADAVGSTAPPSESRGPHMFGVGIPRDTGARILETLSANGVTASVRGSALRISPHLHITADDCDRLVTALLGAL